MKRPTFLTVWLILIVVVNLFGLYSVLILHSVVITSWFTIAQVILSFLQLLAIYYLWRWKKVGFSLYLLASSISIIFSIFFLNIGAIILRIIGISILYLAMKPVWEKFKE